jgi:tyrosyl-tRNA synthetase
MSSINQNTLSILEERGFVAQCTDLEGLRERLGTTSVTFYIGFDGTADSLHVGHLLSLMSMRWLSKLGHTPIALVGGATSLVGDPSFRNAARPMLDKKAVANNIEGITKNIRQVVANTDLVVVNNASWLEPVGLIDFMREVGVHFTVARMLSMETVKARLEANDPMTALEFTYMMLQSHDFQQLAKRHDCTLQMGGSDQWGNIVNGIELTRKADGKKLFGLTTPLLQTADGTKMGKTAKGAVWLDPGKTSPFDFWQFWRNVADQDVRRFLMLFTELSVEAIDGLCTDDKPDAVNRAKITLANAATTIVHGDAEAGRCQKQADALFGGIGEAELKTIEMEDETGLLSVVKALGWVKSLGEARRLVQGGAVRINGTQVEDEKLTLPRETEIQLTVGRRNRARLIVI